MPTKKQLKHKIAEPTFREKFRHEILQTLALDDEQKKFWLDKAETTSEEVLKMIYNTIKPYNDQMRKYIEAAIKDDPSLLTQLTDKIATIKKTTLKLAEKEQTENPEELLEKQLRDEK